MTVRNTLLLARGNLTSPSAVNPGSVKSVDTISARGGANNAYFEIALTGTTAQRPVHGDPDYSVGIPPGVFYYDSTLSAFIVWDGGSWRNPISGAAV